MGDVSLASFIWTSLGEGAIRRWTRLEQRVHGIAESAGEQEARKAINRKIFGTIREMNKLEEKAGVPEYDRTPQVR